MEMIKRKTTLVAVVTLIIGLALGLGIGVWGLRTTQASNAPSNAGRTSAPKQVEDSSASRTDPAWDPLRQMERMQEEIDRAIRNATEQFRPGAGDTMMQPDAGYSSTFDLHDRKDHFELRAYLPDAEASDVNVNIDNDNTLRVSVIHKKQEVKKDSAHEARVTELGQSEQVVTLPEAVKPADMKVERNGHEVVITVPKANKS